VRRFFLPLVAGIALAGCDGAQRNEQESAQRTTAIPQQQAGVPTPGTTPMDQRIAVLGFLNKRNGIARDITLRPGQSLRIKDAIVRLRACETTPPWEFDKLTGAFVELDVQQPGGGWKRVFSGWLYKESPSLNVVEHPVYDVWPKSCVMNFPEAESSPVAPASASSRSSAANPANGRRPAPRASAPGPAAPTAEAAPEPSAADSNAT
jgi:hypothetical protein